MGWGEIAAQHWFPTHGIDLLFSWQNNDNLSINLESAKVHIYVTNEHWILLFYPFFLMNKYLYIFSWNKFRNFSFEKNGIWCLSKMFFLRILISKQITQTSLFSLLLKTYTCNEKIPSKNDGSDGRHSATLILLCKIPMYCQFLQVKNWSS